MGFHPLNLGLRFILEILALVGIFRLGLSVVDSGLWRWAIAMGLTFIAATAWGTFRVPGDRSAKGNAPVAVPGSVRLLVELGVFGFGAYGHFVAGPTWLAWANLIALVVHFALSYDRIGWLIRVGSSGDPAHK